MTQTPKLVLEWCDRRGRTALGISGWAAEDIQGLQGPDGGELARHLALFATEVLESTGGPQGAPPVAGQFEVEAGSVFFIPRFPFVDGMDYSLLVDHAPDTASPSAPAVQNIRRPDKDVAATAEVTAIYPNVPQAPVNLLKIYVHFSEPMSEGWGNRAIRVRRADNLAPLEGVFLPMEPELWDRQRQRLTLLLDPGRIKRGLVPNLEAGYPLTEGAPFQLLVDADFRDAGGRPLRAGADRVYQVGPPVRRRIDPMIWRVGPPQAGSTDLLTAQFDRPLDHALLQHSLWVIGPDGAAVTGSAAAGPGEASWSFTPGSPWASGQHQLIVEPVLEDLAGNSPVRVFDRDITEPDDLPEVAGRLSVGFTCRQDGEHPPGL